MFTFFNSRKEKGTGALVDKRQPEEKQRDYMFAELTRSVNPVDWRPKTDSELRKFPIFDQNGSGSCVAQTAAKLLGIAYWLKNNQYVHFSATDVYQQRFNRPAGGMASHDVFNIISKNGATLEELAPSQNMTDTQMDSVTIPDYKREVGKVFRVDNYITVQSKDIDTVASIIQTTGKGVMVWFFFRADEWTDVPSVKDRGLVLLDSRTLRHSVTAVDYMLHNGKKALLIEDSWGPTYGRGGRRIITEDFFSQRNYFSGYLMNFNFEQGQNKPRYTFTGTLAYSPTYKEVGEVRVLQDILKYEGLFPTNIQSTGWYGGVTAKAVMEFQKKHRVASLQEIESLKGFVCGPKTIAKLNELYGR